MTNTETTQVCNNCQHCNVHENFRQSVCRTTNELCIDKRMSRNKESIKQVLDCGEFEEVLK